MRLFVSVGVGELADALGRVQETLAPADGLRFTDPAQAHVTLKFLGDVEASQCPALREALEQAVETAGVDPFDAEIGGLGVFPSREYISVVWVGVRDGGGAAELTRLHETVESRTVELGFEPEPHDFTPHVTIARMDHAGGKAHVQRVVAGRDPDLGTVGVEAVELTESTLTDDGPVYETVARYPL